ncbi:CDGSH iron-sulfur domain-containing protein [Halorussus halophilus]|uniref:CDGSH iron-sulfur domain-containing protein n=1 Tax=Halorussus halophilus TaxID=2650975 RepID=UPI00130143EF|nr:CDGSH iron-sulfur domain-containing protein [Halorussus halophilus]
MAREVTHTETGPVRLDESDIDDEYGDVAICLCGLSDERPFCDGSHRATEDEESEKLYKYEDGNSDTDARRREIEEIVYADE